MQNIEAQMKSWGKKVTALSFIVLIGIANLWVISRFTGQELQGWSVLSFYAGVVGAFIGGALMVPALFKQTEIV